MPTENIPLTGMFVSAPEGQSYVVKNEDGYLVCFYEKEYFFCKAPSIAKRFHDTMLAESNARLAMDLGAKDCTTVLMDGRLRETGRAVRVKPDPRRRPVIVMPLKTPPMVAIPDALQDLFTRAEANMLKVATKVPTPSLMLQRMQVACLAVIAIGVFLWMVGRVTSKGVTQVQKVARTAVSRLEVPSASK